MAVKDKAQTRQAQIDAARKAGQAAIDSSPQAVNAYYDSNSQKVVILFSDGSEFRFPAQDAQGLKNASEAELSNVELSPTGLGLSWPNLDADLSIPHLLQGLFGTKQWMANLGAKGGLSASEAKRMAARENGKKGGRPKSQREHWHSQQS
ncbi:DUF2442 domain-containing protein [Romeria aff. gracilis LEGE 07310]|uniref:DUF2442 domain-containing protein n=1 Tax=Vasconcelosia minhoensis LEGE 07310 TaxID=915328 RepID=A0A8J7A8S9_9CYAN|nr:DUF2442 domain-containing protein [Romeria gracilis]MBE9078145.1 DUF2442 domain-containing protein [Romeria aff. gracilis LEGE 07310]